MSHNIWHMWLRHPSRQRMAILNKRFPYISLPNTTSYDVCHLAKQCKFTFPVSTSYASFTFDVVHVDIWGSCAMTSMNGDRYFLTIVDDHSRFTWLYIMKNKVETHVHLINFVSMVKTQFQKKVLKLLE